jgi:hypothetical protein
MKRRVVEKKLTRWGEMKGGMERTDVRYVVEEFTEHDGCWHVMRYKRSINGDDMPADFDSPEAARAFMRGEWGVVQENVVDEFDTADRDRIALPSGARVPPDESDYEDDAEEIYRGLPQGEIRMPD